MKGGHTLHGPGVHRRTPLWTLLTCGNCTQGFVGNVYSVPTFFGQAACRSCYDRLNRLRLQAGLSEWDTPDDAYPVTPDEVHPPG